MALHLCSNPEDDWLPKNSCPISQTSLLKAQKMDSFWSMRQVPHSEPCVYLSENAKEEEKKQLPFGWHCWDWCSAEGWDTQDGSLYLLLDTGFQSGHFRSTWLVSLHFFFLAGSVFLLHSSLFYHLASSLPQSGPRGSCNTWVFLGSLVEASSPSPPTQWLVRSQLTSSLNPRVIKYLISNVKLHYFYPSIHF